MPTKADFDTCIDALKSLGAPRVWSMLVSIFGDLAFQDGDRIDGPLLTHLTDGMDIKPEAVRVALHRLRNDGWIDSSKVGRTSSHALTDKAIQERNAVAPLIYNPTTGLEDNWQIAVLPSADGALRAALSEAGFVPLAPRVFAAHCDAQAPKGVLTALGTESADWTQEQIIPAELTAAYDQLLTALLQIKLRQNSLSALSVYETALLRSMIVHYWRRLVLRSPYLPPSLIGADWPGHQCRDFVVELLDALPRPSLEQLTAKDRRAAL